MARNTFVRRNQYSQEVPAADVDTDGSGDVVISLDGPVDIQSKGDVQVSAEAGYVANVQSVSGGDVTVRIFESAGSAAALSAVTGSSDVTALNFTVFGR